MSLVVGQRMVRTDDGMRGVVEMVTMPGFELEEKRITYVDRGEKRIAGKREVWEAEKAPPRRLRDEEIMLVAISADRMLEALDKNLPTKWWERPAGGRYHDTKLCDVIIRYLEQRG